VTLAKELAADVSAAFELAPPAPVAVLIHEAPFKPDATVEALYPEPPDAAFLTQLIGHTITVEPLPDQDWIRLSSAGLPPVRAVRPDHREHPRQPADAARARHRPRARPRRHADPLRPADLAGAISDQFLHAARPDLARPPPRRAMDRAGFREALSLEFSPPNI